MSHQVYYNLEDALKKPKDVTELNIHHYDIKEEDYQKIAGLVNLEKLYIAYFPLNFSLDFLRKPHKIHTLSLVRSSFKNIPDEVLALEKLKSLNLSGNPIQEMDILLTQKTTLEELNFNNCKLKNIPPQINLLENLKTLYIENNKISSLPDELCRLGKLRSLNLTKNKIEELPLDFALLNLDYLGIKNTPFYYRLGQKQRHIATLLQQFEKKKFTDFHRKLYFQLFLGNLEKVEEIAGKEEILEGLNNFNKTVRENALTYLHSNCENPFINPVNLNLHIVGRLKINSPISVKQKVAAKNIKVSRLLDENVTHVVLGDRPKDKIRQAMSLNIPIVSKGYLKDFLTNEEKGYLNEENERNELMSQKIIGLLKTDDVANQQLALGIILGGGIHPSFFYELLLLFLWNKNAKVRNQTIQILERYLPTGLFLHLKQNCKSYYDDPSEDSINQYLNNLMYEGLQADELGWQFYLKTKRGKKFCLEYDSSFLKVAKNFVKNSTLSFQKFKLSVLNKNISFFENLKCLYLNDNFFQKLPEELATLQKLAVLNLAKNQFAEFPDVLLKMPRLKILDLSNNQLKEIPQSISLLKNLVILDLGGNLIEEIPDSISHLKHLKRLLLVGNKMGRNKKMQLKIKSILPQCEVMFVKPKKEVVIQNS